MCGWPLKTLIDSGIKDIMIVLGGESTGEFVKFFGDGSSYGCRISYGYQSTAGGIADALAVGREFCGASNVCVILGDNVFGEDVKFHLDRFVSGGQIFVKQVDNPEAYGVVEMQMDIIDGVMKNRVKSIEEKPKKPKSRTIATGLYLYDTSVWSKVDTLVASERREKEITDLNNLYLASGTLLAAHVNGLWCDCGESIDVYAKSCWEVRKSFQ